MSATTEKHYDARNLLPYTLYVADFGLDTELAFRSDLTRDFLYLRGEDGQLVNHVVDSVDQAQHLSGNGDTGNLLVQVSARDSSLQGMSEKLKPADSGKKSTHSRNSDSSHLQRQLSIYN